MIKQLVELADSLDKRGYHKLASEVDSILKKIGGHDTNRSYCDYHKTDKEKNYYPAHGSWDTLEHGPDCPKCIREGRIEPRGLGHHTHTNRGDKS